MSRVSVNLYKYGVENIGNMAATVIGLAAQNVELLFTEYT